MSWKGKVFGSVAGFAVGGPVGAVVGGILGHQMDKSASFSFTINNYSTEGEKQQIQSAFFAATFSVMGHVAKADGIVSKAEIDVATRIMDQMRLSPELRSEAIKLFQQGKQNDFPLTETLSTFLQQCGDHKHLLYMFLELQLQSAFADGEVHLKEEALLLQICEQLNISQRQYQRIKRRLQAQQRFQQRYQQHKKQSPRSNLKDAYEVLGLNSSASDDEVKKSYRLLVSQHHPDKLLAKGLPEEMMILAKEKTQQITKAYETIKETRKR